MSSSSNNHALALTYSVAVRDVRYHSASALTFLVWQACLTFDDEVQYVWAMRNKSPFKWTYFYLRYVVLVAHVTHNYLMEQLGNGSNPPLLCDMWCAYTIVFTQSLATSLELILAVRVYALYNRSRKVALLLSILILVEIGKSVRMLWLRHAILDSYGACLLLLTKSASARNQSILGFIVHCTLIGLTLFKYIVASRAGWGRTPLVSLVLRDASTVYATRFFILIAVLLLFGLERERGVAAFFWSTALISVTGCYLVVNMERFARREIPAEEQQPVLTGDISIAVYGSGMR